VENKAMIIEMAMIDSYMLYNYIYTYGIRYMYISNIWYVLCTSIICDPWYMIYDTLIHYIQYDISTAVFLVACNQNMHICTPLESHACHVFQKYNMRETLRCMWRFAKIYVNYVWQMVMYYINYIIKQIKTLKWFVKCVIMCFPSK
jgi:hypothetical protein